MCDYLRSAPIRRVHHPLEESPIWSVLGSIISGLVACVISLPLFVILILILPFSTSIRWILFKLHQYRQAYPQEMGPESMRAHESRWLGDDWNNSVVHSTLIFDSHEGLNVDQFRRLFSSRILPVYPRLTRLPVPMPVSAGGGCCWIPDQQFSVAKHVVAGPQKLNNFEEISEYVSTLLQAGLPKDKPPWEFQVIPPHGQQKDTVVVVRVHQSIADGTSLLRVLCHSLADCQILEILERPQYGCLAFGLNVFRACLTGPFTFLVWLCLSAGDCNPLTRHCTWSGSLTVSWSASITLPKVIRIKQVTRSSVNCVVLSALAGALRNLLKGCGVRRPPNVKVLVPLDIRSQPVNAKSNSTMLGNKSASVVLSLPVSLEGCIPRLWATRRVLAALRTSSDPILVYIATAALMAVTPASVARYFLDLLSEKASLQFSCLPGPSSQLSVGGERLKQMFCLLPAPAHVGISVTAITYGDQVHVSVVAERALGPAAQLLLDYLENQIEVLWTLLLHRRVPGEGRCCSIPFTPEILNSPVQEIETRLSIVQREVIRLSSDASSTQERKLSLLRAEFTQLVSELKRRQSFNEGEREDRDIPGRRVRALSCSIPSRPSATSLKNILPFKGSSHIIGVKEKINEEEAKYDQTVFRIEKEEKSQILKKCEKLAPIELTKDNSKSQSHSKLASPEKIGVPSSSQPHQSSPFLNEDKHRKNSFEIIRDRNKRKEFRPTAHLNFPQQLYKDTKSPDDGLEKLKESESELDTETDYSDTTIKISDDDTMDLDYDDLKNSGPITKNLRDIYCSNYLDHKLNLLKLEETKLSQQIPDVQFEFYRAIDDNDAEGGLLI